MLEHLFMATVVFHLSKEISLEDDLDTLYLMMLSLVVGVNSCSIGQ